MDDKQVIQEKHEDLSWPPCGPTSLSFERNADQYRARLARFRSLSHITIKGQYRTERPPRPGAAEDRARRRLASALGTLQHEEVNGLATGIEHAGHERHQEHGPYAGDVGGGLGAKARRQQIVQARYVIPGEVRKIIPRRREGALLRA